MATTSESSKMSRGMNAGSSLKLKCRINGRQTCLVAALSTAASMLPHLAQAQTPTPVFQATAGDFNTTTGILTSDFGPTGQITLAGSVSVTSSGLPAGQSAFLFNGTGGFNLSSAVSNSTNQYTILSVIMPTAPTSAPLTVVAGVEGSLQYRVDPVGVNSSEPAFLSRAQYQFGNSNAPISTSAFSITDGSNNPGVGGPDGVILNTNGVVVGDAGGTGQNKGNISTFGIASHNNGTFDEAFNGEIAEVRIYNGVLSTAMRQQLETPLFAKYGVSTAGAFVNNFNYTGGSGDFLTPTSWDQGAAPSDPAVHQATISNGATVDVGSSDSVTLFNLFVGDSVGTTTGNLTISGGSLAATNDIAIGNAGGSGSLGMSGGSISAKNLTIAGGPATGIGSATFTQTNGSVTTTNNFVIGNTGVASYNLTGGSVTAQNFLLGVGTPNISSGTVVQSGGTNVTVNGNFVVGNGAAGFYTLMTDGSAINAFTMLVGIGTGGTGVFNQVNNTAVTIGNDLEIGYSTGTGVYNISNGTLTTNAGNQYIRGYGSITSALNLSGTANFTTNSGTLIIGEQVGNLGSTTGVLNITDSASLNAPNQTEIWVGNNTGTLGNGIGYLNISSGTLTANNFIRVGHSGATGTINLSGTGTINLTQNNAANDALDFGDNGIGLFNQTGGTVNAPTVFTFLGTFNTGVYNMSGGVANLGTVIDGYRSVGVLNVTGTAQLTAIGINLGQIAGSTGTLNLSGGVVNTGSIFTAGGTNNHLYFNGGKLQASASNTAFIGAFTSGTAVALAGGALIDTNGNNIGFATPISSPTGVAGGLTKIGAGTLTLNSVNSYGGSTNISAGTLQAGTFPGTSVPVGNFSFENIRVGSYTYFNNTTDGSWTYTSNGGATAGAGITVNGAGFGYAGTIPDGNQYAFIQRAGAITQTINFPQTATYGLSFYNEQRNGGNSADELLAVTVDGTNISSGNFDPGTGSFTQTTFIFNASAGTHVVKFQGVDPNSVDSTALVDKVALYGNYGLSQSIPNTSAVIIGDSASLDLNGAPVAIGSLTGTALSSVTMNGGTLSTGGDNTSTNFAGTIIGTGSFTKTGTGVQTLSGSNTYTGGTTVGGGTLAFASPTALPLFSALNVSAGAIAQAATHAGATKNTLFVTGLSLAGTTGAYIGKVDLTNNDMVVRGGSIATLTSQTASGYANGSWQGSGGILSSTAATDSTHLTALGVIQNSVDGSTTGNAIYNSFDGQSVSNTDVLVKYTYYGDANVDGRVDGTDYSRIDNGFISQIGTSKLTGWYNGDFNYDGAINGSDYTLIDNAFNSQGAQFTAQAASIASQIAGSSAVPEPTTMTLLAIGTAGLLGRRRRA